MVGGAGPELALADQHAGIRDEEREEAVGEDEEFGFASAVPARVARGAGCQASAELISKSAEMRAEFRKTKGLYPPKVDVDSA